MNRAPRVKMLTQSTFEQLCRQACSNPEQPRPDETVDDAFWRGVCQQVSRYLNAPLMFRPSGGGSRGNIYRITLLELVEGRLKGSYYPVAIASNFINAALEKEDG